MKTYDKIERHIEKQFREKDKRKRKRQRVSGKSVFTLQKLIQKTHGRKLQKLLKKKRSNN